MMISKFLHRYCDRYAAPIAQAVASTQAAILTNAYEYVLCIPAYDESPDFIAPLLTSIRAKVLVIMVFNSPDNQANTASHQRTQAALQALTSHAEQVSLVTWNSQIDILTVDCCTAGRQLPAKEGVGLARKIAGDLAVAAIAHHKVESPWIYCTDADVQLPHDYFTAVPNNTQGCAAVLYPFRHAPVHENILQYEISLRYYVLQLAQVGSPYAFQTVGSSMAAHAKSYAAVRGFPKRNAAEDFYILNKLAKTGELIRLDPPPLTLSSRQSHRVPFGTGAAMNRLADDPVQRLYHPEIFKQIGNWFQQMEQLWADRDCVQAIGLESWWKQSPMACEEVLPVLIEQGLPKVLTQAFRQCRDRPHFLYYLHVWFDAFRTLRFIHLMRDRGYPSIQISDLSKFAPELNLPDSSLESINNALITQEQDLSSRVGPTQLLSSAHSRTQPSDAGTVNRQTT